MKNILFKLFTLFFVLSTISSPFVGALAADEASDNNAAAEVMTLLGVIPEEYQEDETVTRGQFARYLAVLLNTPYGLSLDSSAQIFPDVPIWNSYSAYIQFLVNHGIIKADGRNFRPQEPITANEMYRALLICTGYDFYNLPDDSLAFKAAEIKLTKNVSVNRAAVTHGQLIKIFNNLLDVSVMENTTYPQGTKIEKTGTFMNRILKLHKNSGVLVSDGISSIRKDKGAGKGFVEIDSHRYKTDYLNLSLIDLNSLLGMKVRFHYSVDESGELWLRTLYTEEQDNEVLLLETSDTHINYSNGKFGYYFQGRTRFAAVSSYADIQYNGRLCGDEDFFAPEYGSVTLIDNNNDGIYDVVFIDSRTIVKVETINKVNFAFVGKTALGAAYAYTSNGTVTYTVKDSDGRGLELSSVRSDDVLLISESLDGSRVKIIVCRETVSGSIEETYSDGDYKTFSLGQNQYKEAVPGLAKDLSIGAGVEFTVDENGAILWVKRLASGDSSWRYGYVIAAASPKKQLAPMYQIKLLDEDGKIKILDAASKVLLNGSKVDCDKLNLDAGIVIRYKLSGNVIHSIDTPEDKPSTDLSEDLTITNDNELLRRAQGRYHHKRDLRIFREINETIFGGEIIYIQNPLIFVAPEGSIANADDKDFSVIHADSLRYDATYNITGYNLIQESPICNVLVLNKTGGANDYVTSSMMMVDSFVQVLDSEGLPAIGISGLTDGSYKTMLFREESQAFFNGKRIAKGDVVTFTSDSLGEIINIQLVYSEDGDKGAPLSSANPNFGPTGDIGFNSPNRFFLCYLKQSINSDYYLTQSLNLNQHPEAFMNNGAHVYIYDKTLSSSAKVYAGNFNDISGYNMNQNEKLIIQLTNSSVKAIAVIR